MNRKMFVSTVLVLLIIVIYTNVSCANSNDKHWAYDTFKSFAENGYIDDEYGGALNDFISKGEFAKITNSYYSYESSDSYDDALKVAEEIGYMKNAKVEDTISREEACAIVCKLTNSDLVEDEIDFTDASEISPWAVPYVSTMISNEIIIGYPNQSFKPQKLLTKAEFIVMLSRIKGVGGADDENIELIFDEVDDLEIGTISFSGENLYVIPIEEELSLEVGDRILLSITLPEDVQDDDLIVEDYDDAIVEFNKEIDTLTAISSGDTAITFKTKDDKFVKKFNLYIH